MLYIQVDDIISTFNKAVNEQSLFNFMQGTIAHLKQMGKIRTAENYSYALKSFMQFRQCKDVALSEIDSDLMQAFMKPISMAKGRYVIAVRFICEFSGPYITEHWKKD